MRILSEGLAQLDPVRRRVLLGGAGLGLVGAVLFAAEVLPDAQVAAQLLEGRNSFHSWSLLGVFALHLLHLERAQRVRAALLASLLELGLGAFRSFMGWPVLAGVGLGLGVFALANRASLWLQAPEERRQAHFVILFDMLTVVSFPAVTAALLSMTALVRPVTFDGLLVTAERGYGIALEDGLVKLFQALPWLRQASFTLYLLLLAALAVVHGLRHRVDPRSATTLSAFLLVGVVGYVLYFLFPVAGPAFAFPDGAWVVPPGPLRPTPVPRNCMPSLHSAWALVIFFQTRGLQRWVRAGAAVFLTGTLLATVGLGFHYVIDLVVAVPFAVVLDAQVMRVTSSAARVRGAWTAGGAAVVLWWLLLLRFASGALGATPGLMWLLTLGTLAFSWVARRKLRELELEPAHSAPVEARPAPAAARGVTTIGLAFVMSGLASIVYEVVFAKSLALTFGSTSLAQTAVLTTYMGGIGVGSWLGARWVSRRPDPLRIYALCEAGVAVWCLAAPLVLDATQRAYVWLAGGSDPSSPGIVALQVLLSVGTLVVPTVLMGATTPALAQHFALQSRELAPSIRLLYGANTLGAGLGALLTGYVLLPGLGIQSTLFVAVALNLSAALVAWRLHQGGLSRPPPAPEGAEVPGAQPSDALRGGRELQLAAWCALAVLTIGGAGSLALEVLSVHLLAVVVGTSAYAFALMLATFLLALSLGAAAGARLRSDGALEPVLMVQALLALCVLAGVFLWDQLPDYFLSFAGYARAQTFAEREFIRMVVCVVALFPPAFLLGASWPLAMAVVLKAFPGRQVRAFGVASGLNTAGNMVGALGAHFLLVPQLGSLRSLQLLAGVSLVLAIVPLLLRASRARPQVLVPIGAALLVFAVQPSSFDLTRLASGANVYFLAQTYGEVVAHAESSDGGLTTIARSTDKAGKPTLTMLTNGKFQGDDSPEREVPAQYAIALTPLLHTRERGAALIVGYGTGCSAAALHHAGYAALDVVELSKDVMTLANTYFRSINDAVTEQPGVRTFITDGRNFLLLRDERYDLVSLEISSIWFAGAASLYNEEFYDLVSRRLKPQGVLQQWVQLHRLRPLDVATILASVRARFERVWLYFGQSQGIIVACNHDCEPSLENAAAIEQMPALARPLAAWGGSAAGLSRTMVLDPAGTDRFIAAVATELKMPIPSLISTDDNLLLEYATPKANVRPYLSSLQFNLRMLGKFGGRTTPDLRSQPE